MTLARSTVKDIGADPLTQAGGCQGGVGVEAGYSYTHQVGHATLTKDVIKGYQKNGVVADGSGSTGSVVDTTVTGVGATPYIPRRDPDLDRRDGRVFESAVSGNTTREGEASSAASCLRRRRVLRGGDPRPGWSAGLGSSAHADHNDIGIALFNLTPVHKSAPTPTRDLACDTDQPATATRRCPVGGATWAGHHLRLLWVTRLGSATPATAT